MRKFYYTLRKHESKDKLFMTLKLFYIKDNRQAMIGQVMSCDQTEFQMAQSLLAESDIYDADLIMGFHSFDDMRADKIADIKRIV